MCIGLSMLKLNERFTLDDNLRKPESIIYLLYESYTKYKKQEKKRDRQTDRQQNAITTWTNKYIMSVKSPTVNASGKRSRPSLNIIHSLTRPAVRTWSTLGNQLNFGAHGIAASSFSNRVINRWNQLDQRAIDASSINAFKGCLSRMRETRKGLSWTNPLSSKPLRWVFWPVRPHGQVRL